MVPNVALAAETTPDQAPVPDARAVRLKVGNEDWIMRGVLAAIGLYLIVAIVLPLYALLSKGFQDRDGNFTGLDNFTEFFTTPALSQSVANSLTVSLISTVIVVSLAFVYAYALTRSCMAFKSLFKGIALIPILMPSLLPAISLIFMFGKQGFLTFLLFGNEIYGPIGIVMGEVFYVFPHVLMIILISMSMSDGSTAQCKLDNKRGRWDVKVPSTPMIRRSDDGLKYDCSTEDGRTASGMIPSTVGAKIVASVTIPISPKVTIVLEVNSK